jgi:hypothetical protein
MCSRSWDINVESENIGYNACRWLLWNHSCYPDIIFSTGEALYFQATQCYLDYGSMCYRSYDIEVNWKTIGSTCIYIYLILVNVFDVKHICYFLHLHVHVDFCHYSHVSIRQGNNQIQIFKIEKTKHIYFL